MKITKDTEKCEKQHFIYLRGKAKMKQEIAKNQYYEIYVDQIKNRIYYSLFGFWQSVDLVPNNIEDLATAISKLKPGFDFLTDLRTMKPPPEELAKHHMNAQKLARDKGLSRIAEVYDQKVVKFMAERYARESKANTKAFASVSEAEAWLDSSK